MHEYTISTFSTALGSGVQTFYEFTNEQPSQVASRFAQQRANFSRAESSASVFLGGKQLAEVWRDPEGQEVKIKIEDGRILTGVVTGTSVMRSSRASERGLKLFVLADGTEYQCYREGAQPFTAYRSAIQPCIKEESANA